LDGEIVTIQMTRHVVKMSGASNVGEGSAELCKRSDGKDGGALCRLAIGEQIEVIGAPMARIVAGEGGATDQHDAVDAGGEYVAQGSIQRRRQDLCG